MKTFFLLLVCVPALIQADFAWSYKCGEDSVCKRVPLAGYLLMIISSYVQPKAEQ